MFSPGYNPYHEGGWWGRGRTYLVDKDVPALRSLDDAPNDAYGDANLCNGLGWRRERGAGFRGGWLRAFAWGVGRGPVWWLPGASGPGVGGAGLARGDGLRWKLVVAVYDGGAVVH